MFDPKAYFKAHSKKSSLVFKADDVEIYQHIKKTNSSKISLILLNKKEEIARFIDASEFAYRVQAFTRGQSYSRNDILNGYSAPQGGIVSDNL